MLLIWTIKLILFCVNSVRSSSLAFFLFSFYLMYIYTYRCVFKQHFVVEALIKYYRHRLSTYFCFDPFKSPYSCFEIRLELAEKLSVFNRFPRTYTSINKKLYCIFAIYTHPDDGP